MTTQEEARNEACNDLRKEARNELCNEAFNEEQNEHQVEQQQIDQIQETIEEIVARVQRGESEQFAHIVDIYQQQLFRYCCRLLGNQQDAEDAVQDIMVKAYQSIRRYKATVSFSAWLYRIAGNHCLNLLRRRRVYSQVLQFFRAEPATAGPEEELASQWYSYPLEKALAQLTLQERNILVLRALEQRSYEEMSEILNVSANALAKRMRKIKLKVRTAMEAEEGATTCRDTDSVMSTKI
ncbi:ECF RNA polymerase sigma factor SigW [compost metagenome]